MLILPSYHRLFSLRRLNQLCFSLLLTQCSSCHRLSVAPPHYGLLHHASRAAASQAPECRRRSTMRTFSSHVIIHLAVRAPHRRPTAPSAIHSQSHLLELPTDALLLPAQSTGAISLWSRPWLLCFSTQPASPWRACVSEFSHHPAPKIGAPSHRA
jgi:hypothetical protein